MRSEKLAQKYDAFTKAAKTAENGAEDRNEAAARQIDAEREKLAQITDQQEQAMETMRKLIAAGEDYTEAREALENLTVKRNTAEKVVEAIKEATGAPDKDQALAVRAAFGELLQQAQADGEAYSKRRAEIDQQIEKLEAERKDVYNAFEDAARFSRSSTAADRVIKIYEAAFGPIDVTGHTCGIDEEAKHRFVAGISAGIENTPAFRGLKA